MGATFSNCIGTLQSISRYERRHEKRLVQRFREFERAQTVGPSPAAPADVIDITPASPIRPATPGIFGGPGRPVRTG